MTPFQIWWMNRRLGVSQVIHKGDCIIGVLSSNVHAWLWRLWETLENVAHHTRRTVELRSCQHLVGFATVHCCGEIERYSKPHKLSTTPPFGTRNGVLHCPMSPQGLFYPRTVPKGGSRPPAMGYDIRDTLQRLWSSARHSDEDEFLFRFS